RHRRRERDAPLDLDGDGGAVGAARGARGTSPRHGSLALARARRRVRLLPSIRPLGAVAMGPMRTGIVSSLDSGPTGRRTSRPRAFLALCSCFQVLPLVLVMAPAP